MIGEGKGRTVKREERIDEMEERLNKICERRGTERERETREIEIDVEREREMER